jgi:hypothetical protein
VFVNPPLRAPGHAPQQLTSNLAKSRHFLTGMAHLYNLIPYPRRALNASQCGVEVEGGLLPTQDWTLNLQILNLSRLVGFR